MSIDIQFPLEFLVEGVPVSLGASAASREAWKARVISAAKAHLPEGHWATDGPVAVAVYYFPRAVMEGDIDNILKPILDALSGLVYIDDHQVERLLAQKFEPDRLTVFSAPTPILADALERDEPLVYIRIDDDLSRGI